MLSTTILLLKDYCSCEIVPISAMCSNIYQQLVVRPCIKQCIEEYVAEKRQAPEERNAPSSPEELEAVRNNPFGYLYTSNKSPSCELSIDTVLFLLKTTVKYLSVAIVE